MDLRIESGLHLNSWMTVYLDTISVYGKQTRTQMSLYWTAKADADFRIDHSYFPQKLNVKLRSSAKPYKTRFCCTSDTHYSLIQVGTAVSTVTR